MTILATGGLGYIGSHTVAELIRCGHEVVIVDNLSNTDLSVLDALKKITGKDICFYPVDVLDEAALDKVFAENSIDAVIHFAALKSVPESVSHPLEYYTNNIYGTVCLCRSMQKAGVKNIVFSSSATVYGTSEKVPFTEDAPLGTTNPYGTSKLVIEGLLHDMWVSDNDWSVVLLRYFNPVGAHESGLIGENPRGIPGNLVPRLIKTAKGEFPALTVCGTDFPTPDGTGVRDYIHVTDLARGHICALKDISQKHGVRIYNLGTGRGYSVMELIRTFEKVNGIHIPYTIEPRRPGDIAIALADPSKAQRELGWKAELTLEDMLRSAWNFAKNKP